MTNDDVYRAGILAGLYCAVRTINEQALKWGNGNTDPEQFSAAVADQISRHLTSHAKFIVLNFNPVQHRRDVIEWSEAMVDGASGDRGAT